MFVFLQLQPLSPKVDKARLAALKTKRYVVTSVMYDFFKTVVPELIECANNIYPDQPQPTAETQTKDNLHEG